MAYGYSTSAWGRVKGRIQQWESTHGRRVPPSALREWLNAELESEAGKAEESKKTAVTEQYNKDVIELKKQEIEASKAAKEAELSQRASEVGAQQAIAEGQLAESKANRESREKEWAAQAEIEKSNQERADELMRQQGRAATISGVAQLGTTGIGLYSLGKDIDLWGSKATEGNITITKPTVGGAQTQITSTPSYGLGVDTTLKTAETGELGATGLGATVAAPELGASVAAPTIAYSLTGPATTTGLAAYHLEGVPALTDTLGAGTTGAGGMSTMGTVGLAGAFGAAAGGIVSRSEFLQKLTPWGGTQTEGAMAGIGAGVAIGSLGGLPGMVIGGIVGGIAGWLSSSSVICTELNRQGYLPDDISKMDSEFARRFITPDVYEGYLILASPIVTLMQRSRLFTQIIRPFGTAFAYESASKINPEISGSRLGKIILRVGIPLCRKAFQLKIKRLLKEAKNDIIG